MTKNELNSELRFAGFAEFTEFAVIHGIGTAVHRRFPLFSTTCKWQESCILLDRSESTTECMSKT